MELGPLDPGFFSVPDFLSLVVYGQVFGFPGLTAWKNIHVGELLQRQPFRPLFLRFRLLLSE